MFKQIPKATREEIIQKIKEGRRVAELSGEYGISDKTIYAWLRNKIKPDITLSEWNRLKRENADLKQIIGLVTLELERGKKNRNH